MLIKLLFCQVAISKLSEYYRSDFLEKPMPTTSFESGKNPVPKPMTINRV